MLTLGCMSFGPLEIVIILGVMALGSSGLTFFLYWPVKLGVDALAKGPLLGKPLGLFCVALAGAAGMVGLSGLLAGWVQNHDHRHEFDFIGILLASLAGMAGWVYLLARWYSERQNRKREEILRKQRGEAPLPTPRFQVWFQDLWVAMLCYGAGLALSNQWAVSENWHTREFIMLAAYLFGAGVIGLLVSVDICRRSEHGQSSLKRAGIFTGIFTLFPLTLPLAIPAWWVWRRALVKAR